MQIKISRESVPSSTVYSGFKGVDFSSDAILVDRNHSPNALNVISDKSGLPEKRLGVRTLISFDEPVNGLFYGCVGDKKLLIAHVGTKLYIIKKNSAEVIKENIENSRSTAFFFGAADSENPDASAKTAIYILTGREYLRYDGSIVQNVSEIAFVPTVLIAKPPNGGGASLNPVNLLQPKRQEKFFGNGSAKVYQLAANKLDEAEVTVKKVTAAGEENLVENTHFTVNRETGQITFTTAPPAPPVSGEDNIFITYSKTVEGYAERISKCRAATHYGLGGANRVFVTGNPEYSAYDRWSEINNPTYFPDLNYSVVGSTNTAVMGYAKLGEYLVLIKEDNQQDGTIFLRNAVLSDSKALFPLKQGITGTGAISPYSFVNLIDEPLFLSRTGIYAVTSNMITAERTLQNRSYFINNRLCKEENLQNAVAAEWNGYYILALNGRAYLLDSRQKTAVASNDNAFSYEGYFWDNIPARCLLSFDGELYFGTEDGRVCKLNTDVATMDKFSDDGEPIRAFWETKADDDGLSSMLKTMQKKGGMLTIKPSVQTGAKVYVSVNGEPFTLLKESRFSLFSWQNLDFKAFTFLTSDTPKKIAIGKKVKKYSTLQFRIENNQKNQSFGIFELVKYFTAVNYMKQRQKGK